MAEQRYFEIEQELMGFAGTVIHLLRVIEDCLREKKTLVAPISIITEDRIEGMLQEPGEVMGRMSTELKERNG
jgi:hypothetical protein